MSTLLSSDTAEGSPLNDKLEYRHFARNIAESICKMAPPEGLVLSINGPWGMGKSTILNFIKHFILEKKQIEQPLIIHFNPWWFSGQEDLVRKFFNQIEASIGDRRKKGLREKIATYAEAVADTTPDWLEVIPYLKQIKGGATNVTKLAKPKIQDVTKLKAELAEQLRERKQKILIIIDDIDRLLVEEIRQLFRVVKAVADFPNVIYLLSFDRTLVSRALDQGQGISGEAYLEKIIQVPFEIPRPNLESLYRLLSNKLKEIIVDGDVPVSERYYNRMYLDGIGKLIRTPRDIVRLTNTLSVTYPVVHNEVNAVDFIAIEALRVFCTVSYETIRDNPDKFIPAKMEKTDPQLIKKFHEEWLESLPASKIDPIRHIITLLFPMVAEALGNRHPGSFGYNSDTAAQLRQLLRIASPEKFPIFFSFSIPSGPLSNQEMRRLIRASNIEADFQKEIDDILTSNLEAGKTKISLFLYYLQDYIEDSVPLENISSILKVFFRTGDQILSKDDTRDPLSFELPHTTLFLMAVDRLLSRLIPLNRFEFLNDVARHSNSIWTVLMLVVFIGEQHGKYVPSIPPSPGLELVIAEQLAELEAIALSRIREIAVSGRIFNLPKISSVLHCWRDWGSMQEPQEWLRKHLKEDTALLDFLEQIIRTNVMSNGINRRSWRFIDPQWLVQYVDIDEIYNRIREPSIITRCNDSQKDTIHLFIRGYTLMKEGGDPSKAPFSSWEIAEEETS